ncbi:hypothetical protein D9615_005883 [Tricholomella constricta]|uniref:F-box domain-containing protein n=1 Tax=Tricholomella constricta TaxID=117010 RepID=A0A8H5HA20_9AGAR|nr:hypothetical protein D9615_005883 [Tricholomella constricta]
MHELNSTMKNNEPSVVYSLFLGTRLIFFQATLSVSANTMASTSRLPAPSTKERTSETQRPIHGQKRLRTKEPESQSTPTELKRCLFDKLPYELLAEIFIFTGSPSDVLAVARCSKFFCATLVNPSSQFIWRSVRKTYSFPPPEPMSIFTEPSYAAFLFGGGPCEVCTKQTEAMYHSFGIRLRLCRDHRCTAKLISSDVLKKTDRLLGQDSMVGQCLPYIESNQCFLPNAFGRSRSKIFRAGDWQSEVVDCAAGPQDYVKRNEKNIAFTKSYMKFCELLYDWNEVRQTLYQSNVLANETFAKDLAKKHGWDYWDMMNATPYGSLHRLRNRRIENVAQDGELAETRKRKAQEALYSENRESVAQHYQRLRSKQPPVILPSLPVFRRLPVVAMLQGSSPSTVGEGPSKVSEALQKEKFVIERLETELKMWRMQAKEDLGTVLGYPNWRTASTKVLHPVERITARFLCAVCSKVQIRYRDDGCLDFAGACAHLCRGIKKQKKDDEVWKPQRFIKDDKASAALSTVLALCKADVTLAEARARVAALGDTILCTSCESGLLLNPKSIVGHSHRHDNMQMRLMSSEEAASYQEYPLVSSLVWTLAGPERRVKAARAKVNFGCRHCLNAQRKVTQGNDQQLPSESSVEESDKTKRLARGPKAEKTRFSFNGLWSHLKAKHGIDDVRDEDVYVFEPIDLKVLANSK